MREFVDKERGLTWVVPEVESRGAWGQSIFKEEDKRVLRGFSSELNECKSSSIDRYVTGGDVGLGNFILWAIMGKEMPYYVFDDGKLVATVILDSSTEIYEKDGLEDYIKYRKTKNKEIVYDTKGYLSLAKAQKLFKQSTNDNNMRLGYLVVVPIAQGKGVGTRVVSSIMHNPQFFARDAKPLSIDTMVHADNIPSQIVFKRNGFKDYTLKLAKDFSSFHDYINEI